MSQSIYPELLDKIKKLQPTANKKEKKSTFENFLSFVNKNNLGEDELKLLYAGDEDKKVLGLCDLAGKKNSAGKFKDSALKILTIIHDLMYLSSKQNLFREEFIIYEENIRNMNLGDHYVYYKSKDAIYAKKVLEIVRIIVEKRPGWTMSEYIKKSCVEEVTKGLEDYEVTRKREEARRNEKAYYIDKLVSETAGSISLEPKTWEDVVKLKNKKLLTTEFLSLNYKESEDSKPQFVDENKELEEELINNFVDPLIKNTQKLNFMSFSEEDRKKMHLQFETFDPVFFLEKLYSDITLRDFANTLQNLEENLTLAPTDDGNLIDKNIYKYLDCKKLLDFLVDKFKNETHSSLQAFKENLTNLQGRINTTLYPLKSSFDLILKSKSAKEIITKFSKFFQMKDKIDHYLKFSNFEELADYLKKINVEIKEISQNRLIYGEFYEFFSRTIEHFKGILIKIIKESSVSDLVIKHFRYLLEFDVEADTVDYLLNGLKEKMCEKIKNDLEFTENFEIRNIKNFFCDEFNVENINEEAFGETLKQSDKFIGQMVSEKYIEDELADGMLKDVNSALMYNKSPEEKKKNLINVESIIRTLYNEIKDFLFMMKVLEENINLKIIHLSSKKNTNFSTVVTEVYFTLFEKLKQFLFLSNFDMEEILKANYNEKKVTEIFSIESSITSNKNKYKFETDQVVNLINFYSKADSAANTLFNENFNKNTLQNLSNLLIDLFDLFEVYLDKDTLEALNDSKTVTIEKIFMAFLNEKIISNLSFFNEESTINFFDTQLSVFNFSAFSFTKTFIKNICKSYKNIIEFYLNILRKTKDIALNHEIIYHSLFFLLKSFFLKFYDFYQTEANGPEDYKRFNCLIVEIMKNYNYLRLEIKTVLKTIFKNKVKEYAVYLVDLENFMNCLKNVFIHQYVVNASKVLFDLFVPVNNQEFNIKGPMTSLNYSYNFYEKYNDLLLYEGRIAGNGIPGVTSTLVNSTSIPAFTDIRSVFIDMIIHLAESIKVFYQLEKENSTAEMSINIPIDRLTRLKHGNLTRSNTIENVYGSSLNERLVVIISDIIFDFFENLLLYLEGEYKGNTGNKQDTSTTTITNNNNDFKHLAQLYIEIELFQTILTNFIASKDKIENTIRKVKLVLFHKLLSIRNKKDVNNADESVIFTSDEIDRKKKVIEEYSHKYSSYFKCFKIKV